MAVSRRGFVTFLCNLAVLATAALTLAAFLLPTNGPHGGIDSYSKARFADMVAGTAYKPFVYRALLPWIVRSITAVTPASVQSDAGRFVEGNRSARAAFEILGWAPDLAYAYLAATVVMYLCFVGFGYYCARLTIAVCRIEGDPRIRALIAILALYLLTPFFISVSYLYDPPQLLLFTASVYYLFKRFIGRFVCCFFLTSLNKETSVLLIPLFAVFCRDALPKRQWIALIVLLVAGYAAVRAFLFLRYSANPGTFVEFQLLEFNLTPRGLFRLFSRGAYFTVLLWMAFVGWSRRPWALKVALLSTLLPLIALGLLFGRFGEWRDYYEAYPLVFVMGANLICQWHGRTEIARA